MPIAANPISKKSYSNAWLIFIYLVLLILAISIAFRLETFYYKIKYPVAGAALGKPQKISSFGREQLYDLCGAEASGFSNPMNFFDEGADPANHIAPACHTSPFPKRKPWIFFPKGKGWRIVIDLQAEHVLTDIYFYDHALASDSFWIYSGNMQNWKLEAGAKTIGRVAAWGWRNVSAKGKTRYLMLRFNSPDAVVTEMVFYGHSTQKIPESAPQIPGLGQKMAPSLREFAGTNTYDFVDSSLLAPFQSIRHYKLLENFDQDTVNPYPNNQISLPAEGWEAKNQIQFYLQNLQKANKHRFWMSLRGVPLYLAKKGFTDKDKPVTVAGMDTEDPMSYKRHANTYFNIAAIFGKQLADTNLINLRNEPKYSGLHLMNAIENGNEEDAWWTNSYWTPMDYFAVSAADFDGFEGKMGPKHGIMAGDPDFKLMTSGMIQLDTNRVKTLKFLCEQLRSDKKFIWQGGVQYHYYSNNGNGSLKTATTGISPEEDSLRAKLARVKAFQDRVLPGIPVILGENGYDRLQTSWQKTPILPGYTAEQSQGIMIIRSLMAAFMAGFDGYNQYMMRSATNDENNPGTFASSGMIGGPANKIIYPAWYYWRAFMDKIGNYQPDAVVSESGPVWIYRLKNKDTARQYAYYLVAPNQNNKLIKNIRFKPLNTDKQLYNYFQFVGDKAETRLIKMQVDADGFVSIMVGPSPVLLMQE